MIPYFFIRDSLSANKLFVYLFVFIALYSPYALPARSPSGALLPARFRYTISGLFLSYQPMQPLRENGRSHDLGKIGKDKRDNTRAQHGSQTYRPGISHI